MTNLAAKKELSFLDTAVSVITGSQNAQDLCRRLVHGDFSKGKVKGAFVYSIDLRSSLVALAGYGLPFTEESSEFLVWDDNPISKCVRDKQLICSDANGQKLMCLPFLTGDVPAGALVVVCDQSVQADAVPTEAVPFLAKLGGYFLQTNGSSLQSLISQNSGASLDEITTRQVSILGLMADGLTNAEIASKVLLSESTVRQETIRIYRALAVSGRLEAVAKARALGLISKIAPPPVLAR